MFSIKRPIHFLTICAILVFLLYGHTIFGDFVFDDRGIIDHISTLSNVNHLSETLTMPYWTEEAGLYRPTTLLSYSLNFLFLGQSPFGFHLINLLIYAFSCFLIFILIKKLSKNDEKMAATTALLFLTLPIHTEVVANITGRSELLSLFFSLLVLWEFSRDNPNRYRAGLWMLLGLGAKETALATLPLVLLIIFIKEGKFGLEILKKYFSPILSLVIGVFSYFIARFWVLGPTYFLKVETGFIENHLMFSQSGERISTALKVIWMYFEKTFWPLNLCSDYSYNQIPLINNFINWNSFLGLTILILSFIGLFFLTKKPLISLASGIFLFSILPVSNLFFPIGTIAGERLFYYPSLGLCLIIIIFISEILKNKNKIIKNIFFGIFLFTLAFFSIITFRRASDWISEEKLFISAAKCSPNSVLSLSNLGAMYYIKGDLNKAKFYLEKSKEIKPIYSKGLNNLGLVYWKLGNNEKAKEMYFEALRQKFPYPGVYENLYLLYLSQGNKIKADFWLKFMKK